MTTHLLRHRMTLAFALVGLCAGRATLRADSTAFSGQATVGRATVTTPIGDQTVVVADTGALPQSGGGLEKSVLDASVPGLLTAEVGHASTIGQGDRSRSRASVANVTLSADGNTISAEFLAARATAVCGPGG